MNYKVKLSRTGGSVSRSVWLAKAVRNNFLQQVAAFLLLLSGCCKLAGAEEGKGGKKYEYEPAVVTLRGTIVEEAYGEDASPSDRGRKALILKLDEKISVSGKPGDDLDTEEKDVREIHLNVDPGKHPIAKASFGKTRYTVTGTLYHAHTVHHLRPIVMMVSDVKAEKAPGKRKLNR